MTTREEAIAAAAQVYGAILADPERREELRAHRAAQTAGCPVGGQGVRRTTRTTQAGQKSA